MSQQVNFSELQNLTAVSLTDQLFLRVDNGLSGEDGFGRVPVLTFEQSLPIYSTVSANSATWGGGSGAGLTIFSEVSSKTSPNDSISVHALVVSSVSANVDFALVAKGQGAILAQIPDGTSAGGDKRGAYATDLQKVRNDSSQVASGAQSVIVGGINNTASASASLVAGGNLNFASGNGSVVVGGLSSRATNTYSFVGGGLTNTASGSAAFVGGGQSNIASATNSVVLGGTTNTVSGTNAFVGTGSTNVASNTNSVVVGGNSNRAYGSGSFVGAGTSNIANSTNSVVVGGSTCLASGVNSFVGGGTTNTASGTRSTVGGGQNNTASSTSSTVAGGTGNNASNNSYTTVAGGQNNTSSGNSSFIGGGSGNTSSGTYTTIAGGSTNIANAEGGAIGGGAQNNATGNYSTVAGGAGNDASGLNSAVGGGVDNDATGNYSVVAGGNNNDATSDRCFVGGGQANIASGSYSVVAGGASNTASAGYASIGGGASAVADRYGMQAKSTEQFVTVGDSQQIQFTLFGETANGSSYTLSLDGVDSTTHRYFTKNTNFAHFVTIQVLGFSSSYTTSQYMRKVAIQSLGGGDIIDHIESIGTDSTGAGTVSFSLEAGTNRFIIRATGAASVNTYWIATIYGVELGLPLPPPTPTPTAMPTPTPTPTPFVENQSYGDSCGGPLASGNIYYIPSLGFGTQVYTNVERTNPLSDGTYYIAGPQYITVMGGTVSDMNVCEPPP